MSILTVLACHPLHFPVSNRAAILVIKLTGHSITCVQVTDHYSLKKGPKHKTSDAGRLKMQKKKCYNVIPLGEQSKVNQINKERKKAKSGATEMTVFKTSFYFF